MSGIRYRRGPPTVPNMRAVLKKASSGTRRVFRSAPYQKPPSTVRKRYSVPKTGFCGTRRIFKGPQNSRLHRLWTAHCQTGRISEARRAKSSTYPPDTFSEACRAKSSPLPHWTHLQCAKRPPLSLFAPAPSTISFVPLTRNLSPADPSPAPSTTLGTRNGPRSKTRRTAPARR